MNRIVHENTTILRMNLQRSPNFHDRLLKVACCDLAHENCFPIVLQFCRNQRY